MSRINFQIQLNAKTISQAKKGIKIDGSKIIAGRALAHASSISKGIGNMLVSKFNRTEVAKALRGIGSEDLPAHFGLSDSEANSLANGMADMIRSSVRILSRGSAGVISIRIQAVEDSWGDYLSLPGAQYTSYPSAVTIPVAKWLLIDPSIDIGQAAYDIVFDGDDANIDARIQKVSRSGRAIMVSLKTLGGSGGYVLPSIVSGQAGQNFIEYALGQHGVAVEAVAILVKKIR